MNTFWALYVKEWKDSRYLFGVLGVGLIALELYGWLAFDPTLRGGAGKEVILNWLPFVLGIAASFFAPSFLLARSFSAEWKSETHYQWFALPVKRWITVLCKFAVAAVQGIILLIFTVGNFLTVSAMHSEGDKALEKFLNRFTLLSWGEVTYLMIDLFVVFVLPVLVYLTLSLAVVMAMEGVKFTLHRYQGVVALVFFGGVIYLFGRFFKDALQMLGFLGNYRAMTIWQDGNMSSAIEWAMLVYPLTVAAILVFLGLWLFEKRVEI